MCGIQVVKKVNKYNFTNFDILISVCERIYTVFKNLLIECPKRILFVSNKKKHYNY